MDTLELDRARIRQVVTAVTVCVDIGAFDALPRLFAPSVRIDYTSLWGGEAQTLSPRELVSAWSALVPGFDATWHELGSVTIAVREDAATAECPVDARHWLDGKVWRLRGRYEFELSKLDSWRVALMRFEMSEEIGPRSLADNARARAASRT